MRARSSLVMIAGACALCGAVSASAHQDFPVWAVGQEWSLRVRQYGRAQRVSDPHENERNLVPCVQFDFHVLVRVVALTTCNGHPCVQVRFTAGSDAPDLSTIDRPDLEQLRALEYTLTFDAESGGVLQLQSTGESGVNEQVLRADGYAALLPRGAFPVDWILARADFENRVDRTMLLNFPGFRAAPDRPHPNTALRRSISPVAQGGCVRITVGHVGLTATGEPRAEATNEVEQVWHPGEPWWRSFRRYVGGLIDMEADLVTDPGGSGKTVEPSPRMNGVSVPPSGPSWTTGQEWRLLVAVRGGTPDQPGKVLHKFHVKARIAELSQVTGRECARVEFLPEADAPGLYRAVFTLVVDAQTWSPVRFEYPQKHGAVRPAAEAEAYRALLPTMPGMPLDWVVLRSDLARTAAHEEFFHFLGLKSVPMYGLQRAISAPQADGTLKVAVGLWVPTRDPADVTNPSPIDAPFAVEQVWKPGELWWRSFRRYEHGRLNLEATLVSEGAQP